MNDVATIGKRIRDRRKEMAISLDDLAARAGLSKTGLWQIEKGRSEPRASTLDRLASVLSVTVDWLVRGDGPPARRPWKPLSLSRVQSIRDDTERDTPIGNYSCDDVYRLAAEVLMHRAR